MLRVPSVVLHLHLLRATRRQQWHGHGAQRPCHAFRPLVGSHVQHPLVRCSFQGCRDVARGILAYALWQGCLEVRGVCVSYLYLAVPSVVRAPNVILHDVFYCLARVRHYICEAIVADVVSSHQGAHVGAVKYLHSI